MPELLKTTNSGRGRAGHYHIVYLNDDTKTGMVSTNAKHTHFISYQEAMPMMSGYDEMGQPMMEMSESRWVIEEADGHTHELTDYITETKTKKESDNDVVQEVIKAYKSAEELEKESIDLGRKCEKYYWGDQWEDQLKRELNAKARAANTINEIAKNVDELSGYQRQSRNNLVFLPTEGGDQATADILNVVTKNILSTQNNFEREESGVFMDEAVAGRGLFNVYMDFTSNIRGDVIVERFQWDNVRFGPHIKEDASDCEYLVKYAWYSYDKLSQMFPDKAEDLTPDSKLDEEIGEKDIQPIPADSYESPSKKITDPDLVNYAKKEYKLLEMWKKIFEKTYVLVNIADDFYFNAEGWADKDINAVKDMGFSKIPVVKTKIRIIKTAGGALLEDQNPADLEVNDFYLIPVYGKKQKERFKGIVADAIDPQDEVNKRHSQAIDIANRMVAYGWFYDDDTFKDNKEKNNFRDNSSTAGFVQNIKDTGRPPLAHEGAKFPSELVNLMQLSSEKLAMIMNIHPEPIGANDSGIAIMQKTKVKLTGNEFLFNNMTFAKKKLGKLIVALIQKYYTPERIMRIIGNEASRNQGLMINNQPAQDMTLESIIALLQDADLTKYDVDVSESTWTPTMRLANLLILKELSQSGAPVPPEVLIEFMDGIPKEIKDKLINGIMQMQQMQQESDQKKMDMEIQKTLIAAESKNQGIPSGMPGKQ